MTRNIQNYIFDFDATKQNSLSIKNIRSIDTVYEGDQIIDIIFGS